MQTLSRIFILICWPGLLLTLPAHAAELELDNPLKSPAEHRPAVKPEIKPPPTSPSPSRDKLQKPAQPDSKLPPDGNKSHERDKEPGIDPDAEQVNRGALD